MRFKKRTNLLTDTRYGSARALGQICAAHEIKGLIKARAVKALIQALTDSEVAVRYWTANALSNCVSPLALEPLGQLLSDSHEGVRQQAQRALEKAGDPRAAKLLANHQNKRFFN